MRERGGWSLKDDPADYLQTVQVFDPPPPDFDPMKASDRELALYGFPRRPDREREPKLWDLWEKAYRHRPKVGRAAIAIDDVLLSSPRRRAARRHDGRFAPGGWGGIVTETGDYAFNPSEPANMAYAEWLQPPVRPDEDNPNVAMTVGFWVGIDGSGNDQVLQAGTAATVKGETVDHWAWFEWWPAPPVRLTDFPVAEGDTITVLVCAFEPRRGFASFLNRSTGVTTNVGFDPPKEVTNSLGETAEWIVEGISADLPKFVIVGFHECVAGTKTHHMGLEKPTKTEISGSSGSLTATICLPERKTVVVLWEGYR